MSTLQIVLLVVVVLLIAAWLWTRQRGDDEEVRKQNDRVDTITGWPPTATRVLSTQERLAFGTLVRALPEYMVLAQVPLARFLNVPKRNSYADWLRRVGYQSVDFVVCDMAAQVIGVVELQPPAMQVTERAKKRMTRIARTLKAAKIPLHVWTEMNIPHADLAREALLPKPVEVPVGKAVAAAKPVPATATISGFDQAYHDGVGEDPVELLEPPPSTWFDDLDTDPAPLGKR
jgi:Protein of unknown function (DUF2726)